MKNWKTTFFGAIGAVGVFLMNQTNTVAHFSGIVLTALSSLMLGYNATDQN